MNKEPRITILLTDIKGRKSRLSTLPSKVKNFGNLSLVKRVKIGKFKSLYIKFYYGRDKDGKIVNEMDCRSIEDLMWAYKAFSDRTLWL